eukprot:48737_1
MHVVEEKQSLDKLQLTYRGWRGSYDRDKYTHTTLIKALDFCLGRNAINNALVIIKQFIKNCPSFVNCKIYMYYYKSCCGSGLRALNIFEYLLHKQWFNVILPMIQFISSSNIDTNIKTQIVQYMFPIILHASCRSKKLELFALQWIKACNTMYNSCVQQNENKLLTQPISCMYDEHYLLEKHGNIESVENSHERNNQFMLSPIELLDKSAKGQLYSRMFHGGKGTYSQTIVDYIKHTIQPNDCNVVTNEQKSEVVGVKDEIFKNYFDNYFSCGSKTEQYYQSFVENDVNEFGLLLEVDENYLKNELNVSNAIHRRKILKNIETLKTFKDFFSELHLTYVYNKLQIKGVVLFDIFYEQFGDLNLFIDFIGQDKVRDVTTIWNNLPKQQKKNDKRSEKNESVTETKDNAIQCWMCDWCGKENDGINMICASCFQDKKVSSKGKHDAKEWCCKGCGNQNDATYVICASCFANK